MKIVVNSAAVSVLRAVGTLKGRELEEVEPAEQRGFFLIELQPKIVARLRRVHDDPSRAIINILNGRWIDQ